MKDWGVTVEDPEAEYKTIGDGKGTILFDEFCDWALHKGLDYDPDMIEDTETSREVSA